MPLAGIYYDGQSPAGQDLALTISNSGLVLAEPALIKPTLLKHIKVMVRVANIPQRLLFADGGVFETSDHTELARWLKAHDIKRNIAYTIENSYKALALTVVLLVAIIIWAIFDGIPRFSKLAAQALPAEVSQSIGTGTLDLLDQLVFENSEIPTEQQVAIRRAAKQLIPADNNAPVATIDLMLRKGGKIGANAFALPNGNIVLTDELIQLAANQDEINSVILHEIGHIHHRHALRLLISHSGLAVISVLITGDINSAGVLISVMPNLLMNSSYSRTMEWEADTYALENMQRLSIPLTRFADFLEKLADYSKHHTNESAKITVVDEPEIKTAKTSSKTKKQVNHNPSWIKYISSHPPTKDRIARFRRPEIEANENGQNRSIGRAGTR